MQKKSKLCSSVPHFLPLKKLFEYPFQFFCWLFSHTSLYFLVAAPGITICVITFHSPLTVHIIPLPVKYRNLATLEIPIYSCGCYTYHISKCYKPHKQCYNFALSSCIVNKEIEREKHKEKIVFCIYLNIYHFQGSVFLSGVNSLQF